MKLLVLPLLVLSSLSLYSQNNEIFVGTWKLDAIRDCYAYGQVYVDGLTSDEWEEIAIPDSIEFEHKVDILQVPDSIVLRNDMKLLAYRGGAIYHGKWNLKKNSFSMKINKGEWHHHPLLEYELQNWRDIEEYYSDGFVLLMPTITSKMVKKGPDPEKTLNLYGICVFMKE